MQTPNQSPWVVVVNAGTDNQEVVNESPSFMAALQYWEGLADPTSDVMKRLPDGTLTTEY